MAFKSGIGLVFKRSCPEYHRRLLSATGTSTTELYADTTFAPCDYDHSAVVYPDVVSQQEADVLVNDLMNRFKGRRYEKGHWDAVIINYKEIELPDETSMLSETSHGVLDRIRAHILQHHVVAQADGFKWLPCHGIELHREGELNAHVDSVRFSGDLVCGLSLMSDSIMRLKPDQTEAGVTPPGHVDLFLPTNSLYVLSRQSRYKYTHELLASGSQFQGSPILRGTRLSVIFRDALVKDGL